MRIATATVYKGGKPEQTGTQRAHVLPRADAIREGIEFAQMIALENRAAGRTPTVETLAPAWPEIARFRIDTDAGRFMVKVRDQGRV